MASGYTTNYGLCQWQPEDKFLREEFNGDNEKIDAALKAAEDKAASDTQKAQNAADRALSGLEAADYNIYNLLLQNEYEGKYTGYKKALLYDGFLDESRIASKSQEVQIVSHAARLSKTGQGNITVPAVSYASDLRSGPYSTTQTAQGGGILTGIIIRFYPSDSSASSALLSVSRNGENLVSQTVNFAAGETGYKTITFTPAVELTKGDTFVIAMAALGTNAIQIYLTSNVTLAGTILITSLGASSGTLTAKTAAVVGSGKKALVFVRYAGGTVVPSLSGSSLSRTGRRTTVEVGGQSCTEDTYEGTWSGENITASFTLSCETINECILYDYGIVVI